jgi:hypothetical protein
MQLQHTKQTIVAESLIFTFSKEGNVFLKVETSGQTFQFVYTNSSTRDVDYEELRHRILYVVHNLK